MNTFLRLIKKSAHFASVKQFQVIIFFLALLAYASTGYLYFEQNANPNLTWLDSLWWSIVTITTVGYGDYFPATTGGRIFVGFPVMILGIGVLGYILSLLATAMVESKRQEVRGMSEIKLSNHIIIANYISLEKTSKLVEEIRKDTKTQNTPIVLISEQIEELPKTLLKQNVKFIKGSPTREESLRQASVDFANSIIVQADVSDGINSDNQNLKIMLSINSISPEIFSIVECVLPENEAFLQKANCNSIVCISSLTEQMLVQEMQDPGVTRVITDLTSNSIAQQLYIINAPNNAKTLGQVKKTISENIIILGVKRNNENIFCNTDNFSLQSDDKVILIAKTRPTNS